MDSGTKGACILYTAIQRYKDVAEISRDKEFTHIIILIRRYADKRI